MHIKISKYASSKCGRFSITATLKLRITQQNYVCWGNVKTIPYFSTIPSNTSHSINSYSKITRTHFQKTLGPNDQNHLQISSLSNFFHNIQKKENKQFMTETIKIQSFDSEIIYNSEESFEPNPVHQEISFLNDVFEKAFEEDSQTRIKRDQKKTKPVPRKVKIVEKKKRINDKSGKWSGANRVNYYKAILRFSIQHPCYKISWQYWKPQKFYPRMIDQINRNQLCYKKNVIQTKSFDERQRKQYFQKEPFLDMIELSRTKLRQIQSNDSQARQILAAYEQKCQQKSPHMEMLSQALLNLNEKKYELEDLYCKIMGEDLAIALPEHQNSVFYY